MNWLTHDLDSNRRVGVRSLPWRWHILSIPLKQVEEQAPKPVSWMMCFLLRTFVPVQKLCVNIYIYICIYIYTLLYELCFLCFTTWILLSDDNNLIPGCLWLLAFVLKQHFDTKYLVFYSPSPPRMFLSLALLSEYRIQHGAIGPLYVTSSYSTWIFCMGFQALQLIVLVTFGVVY